MNGIFRFRFVVDFFFQVTLPYLNEKYEWILGAAHISPSEIDNICVNTEQIGIDNCWANISRKLQNFDIKKYKEVENCSIFRIGNLP